MLFLDDLDVPTAGGLEQLAGFSLGILGVRCLNDQKITVVRSTGESLVLQERMVQSRQAVQEHHAENGTKCREENRQLIGWRKSVERAEHGLATHDNLVIHRVHPPDHEHAGGIASTTTNEAEPSDF